MAQPSALPPLVRGEWIPMSWEEFLAWSSGEGKFEWVDGQGIALPPSSTRHARSVLLLGTLLSHYVRVAALDEVIFGNFLLRLPTRPSARMPDVLVIGTTDLDRVREYWLDGPASLVEVVSEESVGRDLREKRDVYERDGVREFLMVDARPSHQDFTLLRLDGAGRYQPIQPDADGRYHSVALPGFWLDPEWLRQEPTPDPEDLLLAIAPDAYEAWLLAKIRSRRAGADAP
jgi:Uma2 family endonuclease